MIFAHNSKQEIDKIVCCVSTSTKSNLKVPIDNVHVMDVLKRKENLCCIKTLQIPEVAKHPVKLLYLF